MGRPTGRFVAILALCGGCAAFFPVRHDPVSEAKEKESAVCPRGSAPDYPPGVLDGHSVVKVEPIYSSVRTGRSGNESRLQGAKLRLLPVPGMTTTSLEALLVCHQARRVLQRNGEADLPNDPYWLPGEWVNISVESEGGNFVVSVRGQDITQANQILSKATAFAAGA